MSRELLTNLVAPDQAQVHLITESVTGASDTSGIIKLRGIGIQGDIKNQNGRIYPREEIARAVDEMTKRIQQYGPIPGECDHPDNMTIALERITHLIDSIRMDGANGIIETRVIPTVLGQTVIALFKYGAKLGVSSRGTGEVGHDGRVSNFEILTIDMVANPSAPDAYPKPVLESLHSALGREVLTIAEAVRRDNASQHHFAKAIKEFINKELGPRKYY